MTGLGLLIRKRLYYVLIIFSILILALITRLVWIQILNGDWYQEKASIQQNQGRIISPRRGTIFDRNGNELAVSASVETISVNPQIVSKSKKNCEELAFQLSNILEMNKDDVYKKITKKSRYEIIKRKVDKNIGDQVRIWTLENKLEGFFIDEDSKRFYPQRNLAAHVIGFTGSDNQGLEGIEKVMDQYLKGVPGKILSEVDAGGREVPFKEEKHIDAHDGLNVVLTIDETIQYMTQKAIEKAIDDDKILQGASAIVMDPRNGDILALVSKPDFDLNAPYAAPPDAVNDSWNGHTSQDIKKLQETVWRDKAVTDTYEPGSTFKAITSAAGLEEKVIKPDSPVTDATVIVGGWPINCWRPNAHGNETFREGVYNSCNPVFVRVAQSIGVDKFYKYVKAFGFYDKTGLGLPGEAGSIIHKKPTEVDMAAASFGQRFQITPIQLITAYSAIANGGTLIKPNLIKELTDQEGNVVKKFEPQTQRNVISKSTADTLKDILEGVVSSPNGTGGNAYVKGYKIAGKTGTSETTESKTKGRYIASFSAIAPADDPTLCVLIVLDHPNVYPHGGGVLAAPIAGKLIEEILSYQGVEKKYSDEDMKSLNEDVYVPDVRNKSIQEAKKELTALGLDYRVESNGNNNSEIIVEQTPKPNAIIPKKSIVVLYTYKPESEIMIKVPDLSYKNIDDATKTLGDIGLNIKVNGKGDALKQSCLPGSYVAEGEIVQVDFRDLDTE